MLIRTKILTIVLAFFALNAAAFILYSIVTTRNYKGLRLEGIEKTVAFEAERLNKEFAKLERGVIGLANNGRLHYSIQMEHAGELFLLEYLRSFPAIIGAGFWFEPYAYRDGVERAALHAYFDRAQNEMLLDDIEADYDYHSMIWYREVIDNVTMPYQVVWVEPYVDDTTYQFMTSAGTGIFYQGRLVGIALIDWEIEKMLEELQKIKPTENSFVVLYDPEHDYLVSTTHESGGANASIKDFPWSLDSTSFILEAPSYWEFGRFIDNGWFFKIRIPKNEIFADVEKQNSRFSLYIALSSVLLLALGYYLVSILVNAPIKRLTDDVSHLALGNLDVKIDLPSKDELGMLAKTFNKMTGDLKQSIEDNAREREEKERIRTELSVATAIQAGMLPCIFPPFPERKEFDLYASMVPAKEVGGDFYDFFFVDKNTLAVVIADVSGKGVPAALFMVIAKTLIKNNACMGKSLGEVFETVNNMLCENNEASMFVTAFMGYYTVSSGRLVYVNAGHNPPLVQKPSGGYEFLKSKPNIILGYMEDTAYTENETVLEPGGAIYLYTDGVTEAVNPKLDMFEEERLLAVLNRSRDCPPEELLNAVTKEVDAFADGAEQADDITMLALRINGAQTGASEKPELKIELEADVENLNKVLDFINEELRRHDSPVNLQNDIDLAVEEIFVNIANYAYAPECGSAAVYVSCGGGRLRIKFEDTGKPYNPLERPDPDIDAPLEQREIGGLGIFLVKNLMDTVEYQRVGERNILTITKKL